jgi:hypothetical protein
VCVRLGQRFPFRNNIKRIVFSFHFQAFFVVVELLNKARASRGRFPKLPATLNFNTKRKYASQSQTGQQCCSSPKVNQYNPAWKVVPVDTINKYKVRRPAKKKNKLTGLTQFGPNLIMSCRPWREQTPCCIVRVCAWVVSGVAP